MLQIFLKFAIACCSLPLHILDPMTSPNTWWEIDVLKFKKALIIRSLLVELKKSLENALIWLNPIIDNVTKANVYVFFLLDQVFCFVNNFLSLIFFRDQTFVLQHIANILRKYDNNTIACLWLMDYLGKIQSLLSDGQIHDPQCHFLFDFFIMSIVVLSGYGGLLENIDSRNDRNNLFAESLTSLLTISEWKNCSTRVCKPKKN